MDDKRYVSAQDMAPLIKAQLDGGGRAELAVAGISMMPLFADRRDSVTLEKKPSYKKYDMIFYRRADSAYVLHRIVGVKDGAFVLCGDNQMHREYPILPEQIIGAVSSFRRKGKSHSVSAAWYRAYCHIWVDLFFLRPFMSALIRTAHRIKSALKGGTNPSNGV